MSNNPKNPDPKNQKNQGGAPPPQNKKAEKPAGKTAPDPLKPGKLPKKPPRAPKTTDKNKGGRPRGAKDSKPRKTRADKKPETPPVSPPEGGNGKPPAQVLQFPGMPGFQMPPPPAGDQVGDQGADPGGPGAQPDPRTAMILDRLTICEAAANAGVETLDIICTYVIPPELRDKEKKALRALWTPVLLYYYDTLFEKPYFLALLVTGGMLAPRIGKKIGRAIVARRKRQNATD